MTRKEAINRLTNTLQEMRAFFFDSKHISEDDEKDLASMEMAIEALEQEPKWIPVSEKLPMKGTQVLCCNKYGSVFTSHLTWSKGYLMFGQHSDVIAWMPLPKPYKAESEEV